MSNTFVGGKVWVRGAMCETCIFRPGNLMQLDGGRVAEMVRQADEAGSCIPCHSHLHVGADIEPVCRGYFLRRSSWTLRLAEKMGIIRDLLS